MSMTSVKQLSKELNISTVRLYQIINELPQAEKPRKTGNRYVFTPESIEDIKRRFNKTTYNLPKSSKDKTTVALINELHKQNDNLTKNIDNLTKQLETKDEQIKQLTKLVDQSQQLQLVAQKQIESKANETSKDKGKGASYPSPESKANKAAKHWWQRL